MFLKASLNISIFNVFNCKLTRNLSFLVREFKFFKSLGSFFWSREMFRNRASVTLSKPRRISKYLNIPRDGIFFFH